MFKRLWLVDFLFQYVMSISMMSISLVTFFSYRRCHHLLLLFHHHLLSLSPLHVLCLHNFIQPTMVVFQFVFSFESKSSVFTDFADFSYFFLLLLLFSFFLKILYLAIRIISVFIWKFWFWFSWDFIHLLFFRVLFLKDMKKVERGSLAWFFTSLFSYLD